MPIPVLAHRRYYVPMYLYKDKKTGLEIEVLRHTTAYNFPPQDDELPEEEQGKERDWERLLAAPLMTRKWPSTTGSVKGRH